MMEVAMEGLVDSVLTPSQVHHQLLGLADVQLEVVFLAPQCQILHFIHVGRFIIVGDGA